MPCSWRFLLVLALGILVLVAAAACGNELTRREAHYSARASLQLLEPPPPRPSALSVEAFTAGLSQEELVGWRETPRYTADGLRALRLPPALRADLAAFHERAQPAPEEPNGHIQGEVLLTSLDAGLEGRLCAFLEAALSEWTGVTDLHFTNSYGPRTYKRGATLAAHGDRIWTHAVSAIVFVAAEAMDAPWPLQFVPNGARGGDAVQEAIIDGEADVLLYESTQPHGRVEPLRGDSYTVAFFHWRPGDWQEAVRAVSPGSVP